MREDDDTEMEIREMFFSFLEYGKDSGRSGSRLVADLCRHASGLRDFVTGAEYIYRIRYSRLLKTDSIHEIKFVTSNEEGLRCSIVVNALCYKSEGRGFEIR
jgi:hypothetical protein